jgi:glycosyltransferase involved in cell wall biosynthesis
MDGRYPGQFAATTSLIFPTYNPGPLIERTWQEVQTFLSRAPGAWEVLFVCDGCTDGTPERLAQLSRKDTKTIRIVNYAPNRGKGFALRQGLAAAVGAWRIFTDVDLAYGFDDILRVAHLLQSGAPVAIASRCHPDSRVVMPIRLQGYAYRRHLQSLAFSALARLLLPVRQRDTQAGLKGMSTSVVQRVLPHLTCDGFGFDCELLAACTHYGLDIEEVPVSVRLEDRSSTTSFGATARMVKELWRIRRSWRRLPAPPTEEPPTRKAA